MMEWLLILIPTIASGIFGGAVATWLRTRPAMKAAELQGEEALWRQISELKADARTEQEECKKRIAGLESLVADLRHDLANETSSLDAFLLLAEANPDKVIEQIPRIREMRQHHKERMAMKRGAREGAVIANVGEGVVE